MKKECYHEAYTALENYLLDFFANSIPLPLRATLAIKAVALLGPSIIWHMIYTIGLYDEIINVTLYLIHASFRVEVDLFQTPIL